MPLLQTLFDASIPGQRINAAREQRSQREAAQAEQERQAKAFEAIQGGDVLGAAAYSPQLAAQYQGVAAGEDERGAAETALRQQAALRAAQAVKGLAPKFGGDYGAAFDFVASKAGGLFGSEEELAQTRQFVAEGGDQAIEALTSSFGATKQRYINTSGGLFDAQTGEIVGGTAKATDPLDAEYKRSQIDLNRAKLAGGGLSPQDQLAQLKLTKEQKAVADAAAREDAIDRGGFYLDLSKSDAAKIGLNIRSLRAADNEIDKLIGSGAKFAGSTKNAAATVARNVLPGEVGKFAERVIGDDTRDKLVNAAARYEETITPIKAGLAATAGEADRIVRAGLPVPGDSLAALEAKSAHRKLLVDTAERALRGQPIFPEEQAAIAESADAVTEAGADPRLTDYSDEELDSIIAGME